MGFGYLAFTKPTHPTRRRVEWVGCWAISAASPSHFNAVCENNIGAPKMWNNFCAVSNCPLVHYCDSCHNNWKNDKFTLYSIQRAVQKRSNKSMYLTNPKNEARRLRVTTFAFALYWRAITIWGAVQKSLISPSKYLK